MIFDLPSDGPFVVTFSQRSKDLLFLRQVGGGYIFTHRLLRDYFASAARAQA